MDFSSAMEVYRVVVNAPCSQGAAGFQTALAPTYTIGTGFFGHSSIGENIGPQHLVHWTRIAYNSDDSETFGNYQNLAPDFSGPLPQAPADGVPGSSVSQRQHIGPVSGGDEITRTELRRMIAEELRAALRK